MPTVDCESVDPIVFGGDISRSWISSDTSSSISVASVPFEVTGEGPTISDGLNIVLFPIGEGPRSKELGRNEDSPELRVDLRHIILTPLIMQPGKLTSIETAASYCSQENRERGRTRYMGIWPTSWNSQPARPEDSPTPLLEGRSLTLADPRRDVATWRTATASRSHKRRDVGVGRWKG